MTRSRSRPHLIAALAAVLALSGASAAGAAVVRVEIKDLVFRPAEIAAHIGDTVEWTNHDFVAHTATERGGAWNVNLPAGKTGSIVLKQAGAADYFCRFHPNMKGRITTAAK